MGQDGAVSELPDPPSPTASGRQRVYLPLTPAALAAAVAGGQVPGTAAHAVTPALREWYVDGDLEELELAALTDAAQVALLLMAGETDGAGAAGPRLRVVAAADAVLAAGAAGGAAGGAGAPGARGGATGQGGPGRREGSGDGVAVPGRGVERSAVTLVEPLRWAEVVSVHLDEPAAEDEVIAAIDALGGAAAGERGALDAVEDAEACDLLWYAPSEVPSLLGELGLG